MLALMIADIGWMPPRKKDKDSRTKSSQEDEKQEDEEEIGTSFGPDKDANSKADNAILLSEG